MPQISFFTPVTYDRYTVLGTLDSYFYLTGRWFHVISGSHQKNIAGYEVEGVQEKCD